MRQEIPIFQEAMVDDRSGSLRGGWLRRNAPVFTGLGTVVLALIGAIGLIFLLSELKELRRQNAFTERSLRQTYRPIGVVVTDPADPRALELLMQQSEDAVDKFSLGIPYYLMNYGQGVLSYVGRFSLLSTEELDFRNEFLNGHFKKVEVDHYYSYARRSTILPYEKMPVPEIKSTALFKNIPYEEKYFVYSLFIYEDQDGNLYDTEHLTVLPFHKPEIEDGKMVARLDSNKGPHRRDRYHSYSAQDKAELVAAIRGLEDPEDHPIADVIEDMR
jgi:hypothetical protein